MADITTTSAAVFIPAIWAMETLRAAENALVAATLVKRYDAEVVARGNTLHVPKISNLSANDKTANTNVTTQSIVESEVVITIDKWKETSFMIEDIVKVQAQYNLMSEYTSKAGEAIARVIDTDLMNLYTTFTNADVGSYGVDIGDATIVAAIQALDLANAPIQDRAFIVYPTQKSAIMKLDKFVAATFLGEYNQKTPVQVGPNSRYLWGDIYGIPFYYTLQVPQTAGTTTQTHNMLIHKEALALALQAAPRVQSQYQQLSLAWLLTVDTLYGVHSLRTDFGVQIRS